MQQGQWKRLILWIALAVGLGIVMAMTLPHHSENDASMGASPSSSTLSLSSASPASPFDNGAEHEHDAETATRQAEDISARKGHALPQDIDVQRLDPVRWQAAGKHPLLNPDLIRIFDQLLGRGLSEEEALGMLASRVPAEYLIRAQVLFEHYQHYRDALARMQIKSGAEISRAQSLEGVLAERRRLQQKFFEPDEVNGLFDDGNRYDAFTVERLRAEDRTDLSLPEKQSTVERLASTLLTPEQQKGRQEAALAVRIAAQNARMDQTNASPEERQAERTASFGAAAAARLSELDRQQAEWQQRIARLAQASPEEQQKMRETAFTATERLRLEGALRLYQAQEAVKK